MQNPRESCEAWINMAPRVALAFPHPLGRCLRATLLPISLDQALSLQSPLYHSVVSYLVCWTGTTAHSPPDPPLAEPALGTCPLGHRAFP